MRDDETRSIATCQLFSQPRASGESATAQVAGWSFLQPQIHSAQEASGNESGARRCLCTVSRDTRSQLNATGRKDTEHVARCDSPHSRGVVLLARLLRHSMGVAPDNLLPVPTSVR